jgi:starch synthase
MNILFASSEVAPFAKTGGLADVSGSLPKALAERGHRIAVVMPFYRQVKEGGFNLKETAKPLNVRFQDEVRATPVFHTELQADVPVYFIQHDGYFDRPGLYGTPKGDYSDNAERFIFFCRAVFHLGKTIDFRPEVIHCHDWQTALIPVYLKSLYENDSFYQRTRTLLTIHNLAYQGIFFKGRDSVLRPGVDREQKIRPGDPDARVWLWLGRSSSHPRGRCCRHFERCRLQLMES